MCTRNSCWKVCRSSNCVMAGSILTATLTVLRWPSESSPATTQPWLPSPSTWSLLICRRPGSMASGCFSRASSIALRMAWLGSSCRFGMRTPVSGDVWCCSNHFTIAARLYVCPSDVTTGSSRISPVIGHINESISTKLTLFSIFLERERTSRYEQHTHSA